MTAVERFFVDTNVMLYAIDSTQPAKQARAVEWLEHLWASGAGAISWQVLHEFYVNAVRKFALPPEAARQRVRLFGTWLPVDTSMGLVERAWHWSDSAQVPYWDALIVAAAEFTGARYLLSEDFASSRRFENIVVVNPFTCSPSQLN